MTQQDIIEQNLRIAIGDMTLQVIVARAEIQSLKEQIAAAELDKQPEPPAAKANGKNAETRQ